MYFRKAAALCFLQSLVFCFAAETCIDFQPSQTITKTKGKIDFETSSDVRHALSQSLGVPPQLKHEKKYFSGKSKGVIYVQVNDAKIQDFGRTSCPDELESPLQQPIITSSYVQQIVDSFKSITCIIYSQSNSVMSLLKPSDNNNDVYMYGYNNYENAVVAKEKSRMIPNFPVDRYLMLKSFPSFFKKFENVEYKQGFLTVKNSGITFSIDNANDFKVMADVYSMLELFESVSTSEQYNTAPQVFKFILTSLSNFDAKQEPNRLAAATKLIATAVSLLEEQKQNGFSFALITQKATLFNNFFARQSNDSNHTLVGKPDSIGENYVVYLHIFLWLAVLLISITWATIYAMANLDPTYDSVIFRTTSPKMD